MSETKTPKSNAVVTYSRDEATGEHLFNVVGAGTIRFDLTKVSEANKAKALVFGFRQRIVDAAAMSRNPVNGAPATPQAKEAAMRRLAEHYMSGSDDWSPARTQGEGPGLDSTIIAAVMEATGKSEEVIRAMIASGAVEKKMSPKAYLTALSTAKVVAPILLRMRAEQAGGAGVDGDELLSGLTE